MDSILSPKESGAYIATVADYVKINFSAIAEIAKEVKFFITLGNTGKT